MRVIEWREADGAAPARRHNCDAARELVASRCKATVCLLTGVCCNPLRDSARLPHRKRLGGRLTSASATVYGLAAGMGDLLGTPVGGAVADGTAVTCGVSTGTYVGPLVAMKNKTAPATTSSPPAKVNQRPPRVRLNLPDMGQGQQSPEVRGHPRRVSFRPAQVITCADLPYGRLQEPAPLL